MLQKYTVFEKLIKLLREKLFDSLALDIFSHVALSIMTNLTFGRKIMRKVLLASTALVALGSVSAHAADITISGSYNFIYTWTEIQHS